VAAFALALAFASLSTGCASGQPRTSWSQLLARRGVNEAEAVNPLAPSEAMRRAVAELPPGSSKERLLVLQATLTGGADGPPLFRYEAGTTFDAATAFEKRAGNCVAFTNVFISMGRLLGVPLVAAIARREKTSERAGDFVVISSHVVAVMPEGGRYRVFDFNVERDGALQLVRLLDDAELAAVALGNQAVAALQAGETAAALRGLELAVRLSPDSTSLLANLGVAAMKAGDEARARRTFEKALDLEPAEPTVLHDLAALYLSQGRRADALAALRRADLVKVTPHTLLLLGGLELEARDLVGARRSFELARKRAPRLAEPLVWLARLEQRLGHDAEATRLLAEARSLEPDGAAPSQRP